ncbi:SMI1/KNR4 family protein [Paraflavisolibacter sp. H34]|uniref:SMI1/KNR4 family protein n=1 Tax=Huijunlia imazamoxiresistens TaxID=3127457 RepID=UPI00301A7B12
MRTFEKDRADKILTELSRFSGDISSLGEPITDDRLERFEAHLGLTLPTDFKYLLKHYNYFSLPSAEVLGLGPEFQAESLDAVYRFEHQAVGNPMFADFVPFSPDGAGNHYCLDLSRFKDGICPVIFWQHDCEYKYRDEVETCNDSFLDWVEEVMIGWTLEDYHYSGRAK